MDMLTRFKKRFEDQPSTLYVLGVALVVVLLVWLVVTVRTDREDRRQRELWTKFAELRPDPGKAYYLAPEELKRIEQMGHFYGMMAEQQATDQRQKQMAYGRARGQFIQGEMQRRLYVNAGAVDSQLAGVSAADVESLENLGRAHVGTEVGPWIQYHLGCIYTAKKRFDDADRAFADAKKQLATHSEGHVLTDPRFGWLDLAIARVAGQREWVTRLAAREKNRPKAAKGNPKLVFATTKGECAYELFIAEAGDAVRRLARLVRAGYYDGRPLYDSQGQLGVGSPWDDGGRTEIGAGVALPKVERVHTLGTLSLEGTDPMASLFSPTRLLLVTSEPDSGSMFEGGLELLNGRFSIIGHVVTGKDVLAKLKASDKDRVLRAWISEPGDLESDLIQWPAAPADGGNGSGSGSDAPPANGSGSGSDAPPANGSGSGSDAPPANGSGSGSDAPPASGSGSGS